MEKKTIFIFSLIILVVLLVAAILAITVKVNLSPSSIGLENCSTLAYTGKDSINMVFFSDRDTAEKYMQQFLSISPLSDYKDRFNFYYIDSYIPKCTLYNGVALFCYSTELAKKASSCPNDFVVVPQSEDTPIRSSSYLNVMSINEKNPLTVINHEFGHAFISLDEEYTPASLISSSSKNCKQACSSFKNNDSCFQGCSNTNYYRAFDNGLMRTLLTNTYGSFDKQLFINKIIQHSIFITGNAINDQPTDCSQQQYYLIEGDYINGNITIISKTLQQGCAGGNGDGVYNYTLQSTDNSILASASFNPGIVFTDNQLPNQETIQGEDYTNESYFTLKIPADSQVQNLKITDENNNIKSYVVLNDIGARLCRIL